MVTQEQLQISTVGPCSVRSPLRMSTVPDDGVGDYVRDGDRVLRCRPRWAANAPAQGSKSFSSP
jgi:hypothetical protein